MAQTNDVAFLNYLRSLDWVQQEEEAEIIYLEALMKGLAQDDEDEDPKRAA